MRKRPLLDTDGAATGNSWNRVHEDEDESGGFFRHLGELDEGCPVCGHEAPLRSTRKGWKCVSCREIVIPNE